MNPPSETFPDSHLATVLQQLSADMESEGLVAMIKIPGKEATRVRPDPPLPAPLRQRLQARGITALWTHQEMALAAVRRGEHTIVSTGTASGKSLCFNLPTIERVLTDRRSRALYLYPTKALAQDQLRAIRSFGLPQVTAATYDGDTPTEERSSVRKYANIVLSNPDMVHFGILSQHARWAEFFANLQLIVVDEAHVLRGVFGSHVGCILRRLHRVARQYGADPRFVMTSATIGNPGDLARRLTGFAFTEISVDGAPRGERIFAFWNPPFIDEDKGIRGSTNFQSARLVAEFVREEVKTIAFAKARKSAELIAKHAKSLVTDEDIARRIRPYRAGYLASERREIEQQLFSGELLGVAATSALELGIDVGGLDAVVLNGFPGTVSQVWQQAGRAGRSGKESVAVLVGQDDPLDQYYLSHPEVLLSRPFEAALVDTTNPNILRPHLASAVHELPIERQEVERTFGESSLGLVDQMIEEGDLIERKVRGSEGRRLHWKRQSPPGRDLDIRSMGGGVYSIVDDETGALIGTVDGSRAFQQIHPGAVYLHQGENFEVTRLDLDALVAFVTPLRGNYYTQSRESSDVRVLDAFDSKRVGSADFFLGRVEVTERVVGFVRKDIGTAETLAIVELDLPETVLDTVSVWYTVEQTLIERAELAEKELLGALHAAEHAGIGILPLFAMADRWDIGGLSTNWSPDTGMPTVFIYDGYPGGAGIAERGFRLASEHVGATLEAIATCRCEKGCPSCVQSPKCGNGNEPLFKLGAERLLRELIQPHSPAGSSRGN